VRPVLVALLLLLALAAPVHADPPCGRDHHVCPTPVIEMGRLLTAGFETQAITAEGMTIGGTTPAFSTTQVRTGSRSMSGQTSDDVRFAFTGVLATTYYARVYGFVPTTLAASWTMLVFATGTPTVIASLTLNTDGSFTLQSTSGNTIATSAAGLVTADTWFMAELAVKIDTGAADYVEARVNGVSFGSGSGLTISDTVPATIRYPFVAGSSATSYIDDVALNDSGGGSQNSWPGSGRVVLLLPVSDNAKGTGWTNDAASTTNLFNSVDNTPPIGIADTSGGTGLNQLRNATSNANSNYDANMTTYAAAGIDTNDTVNVVDPIVATAAPVSTSAKQGTVGVVSNPAITNIALAAGGTSGAFWSGSAGGTYASGWKISHGTVTYAPAVTVTTAPVMRITQVTASTRIAVVCFMGIYVDYTPNAQARLLQTRQAVNRAAVF
jgi:hypothetical protein